MKKHIPSIKESADWIKQNIKHLKPSSPVTFFLIVGVAGVLALGLIRLVFYLCNADMLEDVESSVIFEAFGVGTRLDIVINFYVLIIPILLVGIAQFTRGKVYQIITRTAVAICATFYSVLLMCNIGDIPFYEHFQTHLNALVINYTTSGPLEAIGMIIEDSTYLTFAISAIISAIIFCYFTHKMAKRYLYEGASPRRKYTIVAIILFYALTPIWCRGLSFRGKPLVAQDAYISDNQLINDLAQNPEFAIVSSLDALLKAIDLVDSAVAFDFAKQELARNDEFASQHAAKETPFKHIILIMQESSSANRLEYNGATQKLVPTLDKLLTESLYFENTYSSNSRTCCGIYSIVASLPAYGGVNPTCDCHYELPTLFRQYSKREGFKTMFFVTHDRHYDDICEFVTKQGYDQFFCQDDFGVPESELKLWGVDDHVMFDFAIEQIDKEINSGNRVISTLLTCSNHSPFNAPLNVGFTPTYEDSDEIIAIQYADWALNRFIEAAKQKEWFDDVLFVITGDHGKAITNDYAISESQVHIPLMFYAPNHIQPEIRKDLVAQIDITPTTFAMAGLEFDNRTLGIDINSQSRNIIPYGNFVSIASRNYKWNYIYNLNDKVGFLYDLEAAPEQRHTNVIDLYPEVADTMHHYAACMTQAGWSIHNNTLK